jgi:ABC-type lipoprotein export system ATPase subunit
MIEIKNVVKSFNGEKVLKGVNLTVCDGEFLSIMGESGSGKSTLLSVTGGFLQPDEGEVWWNGKDITRFSKEQAAAFRSREMGFVFQSFRLIGTLTARENIFLPALIGGKKEEELCEYYAFLCDGLKIGGMDKKYPSELSGGQQQRVAIARALLYRPRAVILDEPTGALDSVMQRRVMDLLQNINRKDGTTIVQVTHSKEMAACGSRTEILKDGEIYG